MPCGKRERRRGSYGKINFEKMEYNTDFLIIGAGIVGLSLAYELSSFYPDASIAVIEKEPYSHCHASGRNSGVLHAGFYYSKDSLKALLTRDGNRLLHEYCDRHNIPINKCGKVVVTKDENDLIGLYELEKRGKTNGIELFKIDERELHSLEPLAKTYKFALYSPTTSSVDPKEVLEAIIKDCREKGVKLFYNTPFLELKTQNTIITQSAIFNAGYVINAAGLYADKIAHLFGLGRKYKILPFKGLYLYPDKKYIDNNQINNIHIDNNIPSFKRHVYPVPNLKNPFLGVHITVTPKGIPKIGPTAIPCLWREHYGGIKNFSLEELLEVISTELRLFFSSNAGIKGLFFEEIQKNIKAIMVRSAQTLLKDGIDLSGFKRWGQPGIRAQLFDNREKKLVMDFIVEYDKSSLHILNAVSPAFTCAFSFAKFLCDKIENRL